MINIAILGYGVVGGGVAFLCRERAATIKRKRGIEFNIKYILDTKAFPGDPLADRILFDVEKIFSDPEVEIIVEAMGGIDEAYAFTKRALQSGRHVVTSNKELVARHGQELLDLARQAGVFYLFEASVGGGIPLLVTLREALAANDIIGISGILNGTCNYILTRIEEGISFSDALRDAQARGYAEREPSDDVSGKDSARKLAILASMLSGEWINAQDIHTEGIYAINQEDAQLANHLGMCIRLIANLRTRQTTDRTQYGLAVTPMLVPKSHPISIAKDVYNTLLIHADPAENILLYGQGAGALPTASAVLGDLMEIAVNTWTIEHAQEWKDVLSDRLIPFGDQKVKSYLRVKKHFDVDALSEYLRDLGGYQLLDSVFNDEYLIMTTDNKLREGRLESAILELPKESFVSRLRVLES